MEDGGIRRQASLKRLYEKKAEWVEHFALALFVSLVLGQIVQGISFTEPTVVVGVIITVGAYRYANYLLKQSQ